MNKALFTYPEKAVFGATEEHRRTANDLRRAIGPGVLGSLGATDLAAVPGSHQCGGLMFTARVLPLTKSGARGTQPRKMAVMVSLTPADEIDVEVREIARTTKHAHIEGIYIDQLARAALAIDYDGPTALSPRYWH